MTGLQLILSLAGLATLATAVALNPEPEALGIVAGAVVTIVGGRALKKRNGGSK